MKSRYTRVDESGVTLFDRSGQFRFSVTSGFATTNSPAVQLGPDNPGRVSSGDYQMNPLGTLLPSNIVTPEQTWVQVPPETNIAVSMLVVLALALSTIDAEEDSPSHRPQFKTLESFQVVNFTDYLPESMTEGA